MLLSLTAYKYALYADKNRQTLPELYTEDNQPQTPPKPNWGVFILAVLVELILLFFAIPMALRVAKSRAQLTLHLFFAITATPAYLFVAVAFQTPAYQTLAQPIL